MSRSRNVANRTQTGSPHIITTKLHPAYLGKLLDGTTSHSGAYGTEQSDGRMYYYTAISGSKPIHDPRIGAHFGSQRHKFKSIQLLEQETATHGANVHSVDGRDWCRFVGEFTQNYGAHGHYWYAGGNTDADFTHYVEFTGYFNAVNILSTSISDAMVNISIDGVNTLNFAGGVASVNSPLLSRYVDAGSVVPLVFSATPSLGIHTVRIGNDASSQSLRLFGIELIAQDTTDTASRSKIQIPKQSVYTGNGKHEVSAQAVHYDPFNGMATASGFGGYVDEKSSLGLEKWKVGSTCYRPYNGARVVKWVDVDGVIKTSVTCMPPNAKSIANSSALTNATAKTNGSVANNTAYPTFEAHTTSPNEDNLHEVAKTFNWREFGNGSANGGAVSGSSGGSWRDFSMLHGTTATHCTYCMDDGLTSLTGEDVHVDTKDVHGDADGDGFYITFIGTGITLMNKESSSGTDHLAQNLPYGTHVIKYFRGSGADPTLLVDGVTVPCATGTYTSLNELTFYQPKRPPIPEDACVLADYMLMADFVGQTTAGTEYISKGTRISSCSRDMLMGGTGGNSTLTVRIIAGGNTGFNHAGNTSTTWRVPAFCTNFVLRGYDTDVRSNIYVDTTNKDSVATHVSSTTYGSASYLSSGNELALGMNEIGHNCVSSDGNWSAYDIATPIHTSSHYQAFETPYLHELIGGDRSMEQTNLICSSDGKSWDEITRDTSYIGDNVVSVSQTSDGWFGDNTDLVFDRQRGDNDNLGSAKYIKDSFTLAHNRYICLKAGQYKITIRFLGRASNSTIIKLNGSRTAGSHHPDAGYASNALMDILQLKRGDEVHIYDEIHGGVWSHFYIEKN